MVVGEELDFGTLGAVTDELLQIFLTRLQPGLGGCTVCGTVSFTIDMRPKESFLNVNV